MASTNEWMLGRAPLVEPSTKKSTEVVLFMSDFHVPFEDKRLLESAIRLIQDVRPHRIVLNGDVSDFFSISRFNVEQDRMDDLQKELDQARYWRRRIREAAPRATIDECEGNHDVRMRNYVAQNARALTSLESLNPDELSGRNELKFNSYSGSGFLLRPHFLVRHGTVIRKYQGFSAKAELESAKVSGTSGHTHRLGIFRINGYKNLTWAESGCLCLLHPDYILGKPDWTNGAIIGQFSTKTDAFLLEEIQSDGNKLVYGGRKY